MMNKVRYLFALLSLILGCWFSAILFRGLLNPGTMIALAIAGVLIASLLAPVTRRVSRSIWMLAGFIILFGLCVPASFFAKIFPLGDAEPFNISIAFTQLLIISAAFLVTAILFNASLTSHHSDLDESENVIARPWAVMILSLLIIAKALHSFYWFMIWDSTTDSMGIIWLPISAFAVIFSSFSVFFTPSRESKAIGSLNLLLIPVLVAIFIFAQKVDFHQLTEERAEHIRQAIESYYVRESHYPQELRQLSPRDLLTITGPVIIFGQDWCYDGGKDYYRLGYVDRKHWSDPRLIGKIYASKGEPLNLAPMCESEVVALQQSNPNYPYEYLEGGE